MQIRQWDAVVVGGGVAGLSAAQMLGRAGRSTLVLDAGAPRNRFAAHMHGVLGHDGVDPAELLRRGRAEVAAYGVVVEAATVVDVVDQGDALRVRRADGGEERARSLVVTTGVRDELPDIPGLVPLWGESVLHCPYCHGWEVRGRRLGVLATSPASIHQIELVRQWSEDVTAFTALAGPLDPSVEERLTARGIRIVTSPVVEVVPAGGALSGIRTADGTDHALDAVFAAPAARRLDGFLDGLGLIRVDGADGALVADERGATSHPRIFAAGNTIAPYGNVPLSMGTGSMAGAGANAALVAEDASLAVADARRVRRNAAWEERYSAEERVWSHRVNATLAAVVEPLPVGRVLDVGCGEGADAVWLAEHGWDATGVDVSATAIARATDAAASRGLEADRVRFVSGDAASALPDGAFDLVTASFLHSWEDDFPRIGILRSAADRVAPGGRLLVISHAAPPPWSSAETHAHAPVMLSPAEELALLALDTAEWTPELVEVRARAATAPDGSPAHLDDGVLLLRRRG